MTQAGKCPKCYVSYLSTDTGYYCPQCGDMGWFKFDDSQIVAKSVKQIKKEIKMEQIDLDEIEASLNYLEDWKKIIAELRAAREVVDSARAFYTRYREVFSGAFVEIAPESGVVADLGNALKKLDEARRG